MMTSRTNRLDQELTELLRGTAEATRVEISDIRAFTNETPQPNRMADNWSELWDFRPSKGSTLSLTTPVSGETVHRVDIEALKEEIEQLQERVTALEAQLAAGEGVIMLRTINREQAKEEIRELFASGQTLYFSDIVKRLQLDISMVVELCKELESEGEVITLGDAT